MRRSLSPFWPLVSIFAGALLASAAQAQPSSPDRELRVGVFEAPPYSLKSPSGQWRGFSVDVWREVAGDLGLRYRLVEGSEEETLQALANGGLDVVAGPVSVTMERERVIDFTESYLTSGLSVAVRRRGRLERLASLFTSLASSGAAHLIGAIILLSAAFGAAVWLIERRRNPQFPAAPSRGFGSGLWWAAVTTTGVGYGDKVPTSFRGRLVAAVWMLVSLVLFVFVTASLTATVAVGEFQQVRDVQSLRRTRVGVLAGSAASDFARENQIPHRLFPSYAKTVEALGAGRVDAILVNDEILRYYADRAAGARLQILPPIFMPENFAFALVDASALRNPLDNALRRVLAGTRYRDLKDQYLYGDEFAGGP